MKIYLYENKSRIGKTNIEQRKAVAVGTIRLTLKRNVKNGPKTESKK